MKTRKRVLSRDVTDFILLPHILALIIASLPQRCRPNGTKYGSTRGRIFATFARTSVFNSQDEKSSERQPCVFSSFFLFLLIESLVVLLRFGPL